MPASLTDWLERSLQKPKPFEHRKWLEGLLTFARTTHLKQVSCFTLGKKQNDFCQVKFNKPGLYFNINAYGGSMVIRFTIHSTIKSPWIHHLHLIAIATLCYILLHHRYMLLLTCIIVTYCYSTPLLIDTSFYAILNEKMLFRFCVGFFVLCRWFRQGCRGRGGGLNRKKLRL